MLNKPHPYSCTMCDVQFPWRFGCVYLKLLLNVAPNNGSKHQKNYVL